MGLGATLTQLQQPSCTCVPKGTPAQSQHLPQPAGLPLHPLPPHTPQLSFLRRLWGRPSQPTQPPSCGARASGLGGAQARGGRVSEDLT